MPRRSRSTRSTDNYSFRGLVSPASSAVFTRANVPSTWYDRGFKIKRVTLEAAAYDAATANKLVVQPAYAQFRLLAPSIQHGATGSSASDFVLSSSKPLLYGPNPSSKKIPLSSNWYPPGYLGNMFSLDCLCPQDGWEGGIAYVLQVVVELGREPRSENCKFYNSVGALPLAE